MEAMHIAYPDDLPVSARRDEIAAAIQEHQVVIVAGETGSGKSTQLPKICLELGRTAIAHTQPRRIAARTIAERVAEELQVELGAEVGYQVRFSDKASAATMLTVMTDGVLLNRIHRDPDLAQYDTIVIDEAHERSLTIDFLIGYLQRLLPRRPDLRVIVTSATIDPESFSRHFGGAPIIEVSGRTYGVDVRYRPLTREAMTDDDGDDDAHDDVDPIDGIHDAIQEIWRDDAGDVLVFLSGEAEIRDAQDALAGRLGAGVELLPLYGRLSAAEQHRVFERRPAGVQRRVVLATNVAETSLTVPGIRHVVDTGTARISRYSTRAKVQRLPIEAISQASANQRSGRAGRVAPGIAIRLYAEEDFARRPAFTDPEILRTNLASVILQAATLGLGPLEDFPFLQPPERRAIADGTDLLRELRAIERSGAVTRVGRGIARLPVDPRFARMVLAGVDAGVADAVIPIVAALSIQDPRERPLEHRARADQLHARFADPTSDFVSLLNLWRYLREQQRQRSGNQFRRMCRDEHLNFLRVREWQDVVRQLERSLPKDAQPPRGRGRETSAEPFSTSASEIHKALLAGLLSQIGVRDAERRDFLGGRGVRFHIHPSSTLGRKQPQAVMAAELVETSRLFARVVAGIDPAWAEPLAGDLAKRQWFEPRWSKRAGAAIATERVTLYGVPIVPQRRIQLSRVDPVLARDLLIRHGLVAGEWQVRERFLDANRALIAEIERLEERQRRRDLLLDDERIVELYDARIPMHVTDARGFQRWWRDAKAETPDLLTFTRDDLLGREDGPDEDAYPTTWRQGDQTLRLTYRFEPGADDDGLTVHVPIALLPRLSPAGFDWLVPGMREELLTAMIKALPKHVRRHVVPAADWARSMLADLPAEPTDAPLAQVLADRIRSVAHTPADASDVDWSRVPGHLLPRFVVEGAKGAVVGAGRDLAALQARLAQRATVEVAAAVSHDLERQGVDGFQADLPRFVDVRQGQGTVRAYPGHRLAKGGRVDVALFSTEAERDAAEHAAVRRMLADAVQSPQSYVQANLSNAERLALGASPYPSTARLFDDVLLAIVDEELGLGGPVRSAQDFARIRTAVSLGLVERMFDVTARVAAVLTAARAADAAIRETSSMAYMAQLADARATLDGLAHDGFVVAAGVARLARLPVYVKAVEHRVRRLPEAAHRDVQWMAEVSEAVAALRAAGGSIPLPSTAAPHLVEARWMIEELRVSLFAQTLGARGPISVQRIRRVLQG
ncbi:ATP-dependent RNA helicase HrpA [Agrococcus sp. SGAir0287]|uniref:ATP-dependent RNA helicase HrpA n=1 Tax=Agrococcus sp. SGAir0287 TaxID=2070347 RepID=UPI0010CCC749|nr:ATP-dependent RNA helicase HrpA [Agrococcus sp. SGAir0287]QCR20811.1 ATP-dependent RNA helicase HrpA [Agrococcus sp. SGAir0287]